MIPDPGAVIPDLIYLVTALPLGETLTPNTSLVDKVKKEKPKEFKHF